MKLFLMGQGKLGSAIKNEAYQFGIEIVGVGTSKDIPWEKLILADVCIDCTEKNAFLKNKEKLFQSKKPLIIATTGIEEMVPELKMQFKEKGCLYSPNFSLGFAFFSKLVKESAKWVDSLFFDVAGVEMHHKEKKDQPSGSAKLLQALFPKEIPFSSVRVGTTVGIHSLIFDGKEDAITLTHEAKNRLGFAKGALLGAKWIKDKKGFFTMEDFFNDMLI